MAAVAFEHVDKIYPNGQHAVRDCSLDIGDAELMVLVGPSGCGKSTLLRMLAGLETVSSGAIRIAGEVVNQRTPQERNVAMVFQDYALYPFMTVRRNLEFPLAMRKMARGEIDRRVAWASDMLDLAAVLDRLPKQLSGGQRQRVAMGRALVREPSVSLLDEPLSNLDARLRVEVRAEIAELQQRTRTTMVYVTHDQTEAMTLGQRIAVLDRGVVQQVATPRELYERPANVFVAGFIGTPAMNLFPVRSSERGGVAIGDQTLRLGTVPAGAAQAGVRPEALSLAAADDPDALAGTVEHVEYLGHETLAHVRFGAQLLIARLEGMHALSKGEPARVRIDPAHIHLFDAEGRALRA